MKIKKKSPEMAIFEKPLKFDAKMLYFCFQNFRNFGGFETFIFNMISLRFALLLSFDCSKESSPWDREKEEL